MLGVITLLAVPLGSAQKDDIFDAVRSDRMEKIKAALKTGGPEILNEVGPGGQSPLMHAVLQGKVAAVKFLLRKGADVRFTHVRTPTRTHGHAGHRCGKRWIHTDARCRVPGVLSCTCELISRP